jgi:Flp pilus assembly protein TadG
MPATPTGSFQSCTRGTITIIFALSLSVLLAFAMAGLELARVQRDAGRVTAALTAASEEAIRSALRQVDSDSLRYRVQAAFLAHTPKSVQNDLGLVSVRVDPETLRVVATVDWTPHTFFGRQRYALMGDAPLPAYLTRRR